MQSIFNISSAPSFPLYSKFQTFKKTWAAVHHVAIPCLIELGVSLIIGCTVFCYTVEPLAGPLLFGAIAIQTICNACLRYYQASATEKTNSGSRLSRWIASAAPYLCPTHFSYLTAINEQALIHEAGHAFASMSVYRNANPKITLLPLRGGFTEFTALQLTSFGKWLGKKRASFFVMLAGPLSTLFVSALAIVIGYYVKERFCELSNYLISVGRGDFYAHAWYALTSYTASPLGPSHDFDLLAAHGLHPVAAAVSILAIPIFFAIAFHRQKK